MEAERQALREEMLGATFAKDSLAKRVNISILEALPQTRGPYAQSLKSVPKPMPPFPNQYIYNSSKIVHGILAY